MLFCLAEAASGQTWKWEVSGAAKEVKISDEPSSIPLYIDGVRQLDQKSLSVIVGSGISTIKKTLQVPFALYGSDLALDLDIKVTLLKSGPNAYVWVRIDIEDSGKVLRADYDYPLTVPSPQGSNGKWLRIREKNFFFETLYSRSGLVDMPDEIGNVTVEVTAFDVEACEVKFDNLVQERLGNLYLLDTFGDGDIRKPEAPTIANFPNPFNPSTQVIYQVTGRDPYDVMDVELGLYDILGRRVLTLVNSKMLPGTYRVTLSAPPDLSSGTYFLFLRINKFLENYSKTVRVVLLR
jgi:hypothetical protein